MPKPGGNALLGKIDRTPFVTGVNQSLVGALHNDADAPYELQKETIVHRRMAELAMQGHTQTEIAAILGRTVQSVKIVLRQPHMRKYMIEEAKRSTNSEILDLVKQEGAKAFKRLASVAASADEVDEYTGQPKPMSKMAFDANIRLVDQFLGKAVQPMCSDTPPAEKLTDAELEKAIAERLAGRSN